MLMTLISVVKLTLLIHVRIGIGSNIIGVNMIINVCRIAITSLYHGSGVYTSSAIS